MKKNIILALDVGSLARARLFVNKLYPQVKIFKVGSQLFTACGPRIIELLRRKGAQVFLDLKFFDIPNTVERAVREAIRLKVRMLTLHICGGEEMLKSAVEAARDESRRLKVGRPLLIGVTVLTSKESKPSEILRLARLGLNCGLDGIVCSAREVAFIRRQIKKRFIIITPGIRLGGGNKDDQKRTATAAQALRAGSDFLVIGRPLLEADDPLKVLKTIR
ncbi:MAG TPA: orotidine-5'-phosphate decarboxylase [Candidatus Margulisiibacteriota bacterium]|nr:orotidine-5'-phosphate decarboxylase [Candidatus Margulisiibacteriota bacterium]